MICSYSVGNCYVTETEIVIEADHDGPDLETVIATVTDHAAETEGDQDLATGGLGQGHGTEIGTGTGREVGADPGTGTERGAEADPGTGTGKGIRGVALILLPRSSSLLTLQSPKNQCL